MYCGAKRWQRIYLRVFSRGEKSYGAGQTLYKNVSANKMKIQELIKESARTQMPAHSEIAYKHLPQMLASKVEGSQIKLFAFKYSNILLDFIHTEKFWKFGPQSDLDSKIPRINGAVF